jgi:type I restriction enzyme, S subunit
VKFPRYKYKQTGLSYLREVPSGWDIKRGRFSVRVNPPSSRLQELKPDEDVSFVPMEAVGENGGLNLDVAKPLGEIGGSYTEFENGDVVVAKITPCFENGKGALAQGLTNGAALGTTELHVLRATEKLERRFLFYITISSLYRKLGEAEMYGAGGQKRVPTEFCKDFRTPLPSIEEQRVIADFLDRETAKLDRLIGKKRELIEKLKEKRTALISRTVTRGLNPNVKLKSSGIVWLGHIPKHWESGNLRRYALMRTGHTPSRHIAEYWEDCTIPWFTLADVWQLRDDKTRYLGDTKEKISELGLANSAAELLPAGTVIFSRTASVGFSGMMPKPMATTQDFWNWICGPKLTSEYLLLLFRAMKQEFERLTSGSTHKTIYQPDAASLCICVPPIPEQDEIVAYLDRETGKIDKMIEKVEAAIEKLQEYRTALITAAVTGKIDVRNFAGAADSSHDSC